MGQLTDKEILKESNGLKNIPTFSIDNHRLRVKERRKPSFSINSRHLGCAPRRGIKATINSHKNSYVDWYSADMLLIVILISLLSLFDSIITLHLISHGAEEENTLMEASIFSGHYFFIVTKFLLTTLGLIFLVIHKNFYIFRLFRASHFLYVLLAGYSLLMLWEAHLLNQISPL